MQQSQRERVNFGSKLGAILAAAGSAVGLGNIWGMAGENLDYGDMDKIKYLEMK